MRCMLFACLLLLSLPSAALDRLQVQGYLLPNGLQVLLKPGTDRGHVAIRLVVGVGFSDFNCASQELPHLLEHLLFSGLDDSGEGGLEERMQALGGEWNAFTSEADTTFVIEAPARNQRKVLDLLLQAITRTELTEARLDTARRIVEREDGGHYSHLQRWLDHQDLGKDASNQLAIEMGLRCADRASAAGLTLAQVKQVRQQWYAPNNMTLIVVGELDKLLPAYLERSYGELASVKPSDHPPLTLEQRPAQRERTLIQGWLGDTAKLHWYFPEPDVEDLPPGVWDLLQSYLDWALYKKLRLEEGLSYGPGSLNEPFGDSTLMSLNADLDRDDIEKAREAVQALTRQLKDKGLDGPTFERLKAGAIDRLAWAIQGDSGLADYYWGALSDYEDGRFADPAAALRSVTLAQANEAVRRLFADPGYIRVEKSLIGYDDLATLITVTSVLAALAGLALCIAIARHRRRSAGK
ncbi:M16 family metallopeptidase [Pseudomonas sp. Marseille-Q5115]|uniref:M16 family metallopeptidase n=1 Tax=Pseudomonas sp. Marseille-Q5115 TaxID=2866593 RepID=UPI001CE4A2BA|nr:pitrilysin family protein [Pseudomonas sp. Marseille-Q5115]